MNNLMRKTVTYCQYGEKYQKPTDIWTNASNWIPKKMCSPGDSCHESAPRGTRSGTQGLKNSEERGRIPQELCDEIVQVCEGTQKVKQMILNDKIQTISQMQTTPGVL